MLVHCSIDIVTEKLLQAKAVYGFWPAASVGDDIEIYLEIQSDSSAGNASIRCVNSGKRRDRMTFEHWPISSHRAIPACTIMSAALY